MKRLIEHPTLFYSPNIPDPPYVNPLLGKLEVIVRWTKPVMPQGKSPGVSQPQLQHTVLALTFGTLVQPFGKCDSMLAQS